MEDENGPTKPDDSDEQHSFCCESFEDWLAEADHVDPGIDYYGQGGMAAEDLIEAQMEENKKQKATHEAELALAAKLWKKKAKTEAAKAKVAIKKAEKEARKAKLKQEEARCQLQVLMMKLQRAEGEIRRFKIQQMELEERLRITKLPFPLTTPTEALTVQPSDDLERLRSENSMLRSELTDCRHAIEGLREDMGREQTAADRQAKELDRKAEELQELKRNTAVLDHERTRLQHEAEDERRKSQQLEKEKDMEIEGLKEMVKKLKDDIMKVEDERGHLDDTIAEQKVETRRNRKECAVLLVRKAIEKLYYDRRLYALHCWKSCVVKQRSREEVERHRLQQQEDVERILKEKEAIEQQAEAQLKLVDKAKYIQERVAGYLSGKSRLQADFNAVNTVFLRWQCWTLNEQKQKVIDELKYLQEREKDAANTHEMTNSELHSSISELSAEVAQLQKTLEENKEQSDHVLNHTRTQLAAEKRELEEILSQREKQVEVLERMYSDVRSFVMRRALKHMSQIPKLVHGMKIWKDFYVNTKQTSEEKVSALQHQLGIISQRCKENRYSFAFLVGVTRRERLLAQVLYTWKDYHLRSLITKLTHAIKQAQPTDKDSINKWFRWRVQFYKPRQKTWLVPLAQLSKMTSLQLERDADDEEESKVPLASALRKNFDPKQEELLKSLDLDEIERRADQRKTGDDQNRDHHLQQAQPIILERPPPAQRNISSGTQPGTNSPQDLSGTAPQPQSDTQRAPPLVGTQVPSEHQPIKSAVLSTTSRGDIDQSVVQAPPANQQGFDQHSFVDAPKMPQFQSHTLGRAPSQDTSYGATSHQPSVRSAGYPTSRRGSLQPVVQIPPANLNIQGHSRHSFGDAPEMPHTKISSQQIAPHGKHSDDQEHQTRSSNDCFEQNDWLAYAEGGKQDFINQRPPNILQDITNASAQIAPALHSDQNLLKSSRRRHSTTHNKDFQIPQQSRGPRVSRQEDTSFYHLIQCLRLRLALELFSVCDSLMGIATGDSNQISHKESNPFPVSMIEHTLFHEFLQVSLKGKLRWLALVYLRTLESYQKSTQQNAPIENAANYLGTLEHDLKGLGQNISSDAGISMLNPNLMKSRSRFTNYLKRNLIVILDDFKEVWSQKRKPGKSNKIPRGKRVKIKTPVIQKKHKIKSFGCTTCADEIFTRKAKGNQNLRKKQEPLDTGAGPRPLWEALNLGPLISSSLENIDRYEVSDKLWELALLVRGQKRIKGLQLRKQDNQRRLLDERFSELLLILLILEMVNQE